MTPERIKRANRASARYFEDQETDMRLELALGRPEDLSQYQDCIAVARLRRLEEAP